MSGRWLLLLAMAAGCGKNDFVALYEEMVDQVCACKDLKCVDDVNKNAERKLKTMDREQEGSYADRKAVDDASARRTECIRTLTAAEKAAKK